MLWQGLNVAGLQQEQEDDEKHDVLFGGVSQSRLRDAGAAGSGELLWEKAVWEHMGMHSIIYSDALDQTYDD
jgi:hypothetical protein